MTWPVLSIADVHNVQDNENEQYKSQAKHSVPGIILVPSACYLI